MSRFEGLRTPEGAGLMVFGGFTVMALVGYGLFGLRPELLPSVDALLAFWRISFQFFAQVHIVLGAVVLLVFLFRYAGIRWLPALVAVYGIALASEYLGTGYGVPFGNYEYTALLGSKFGDRVPWVIPLSWFLMAVPSYVLARVTFPAPGQRWGRLLFAALVLTLWDLALDPAMSYQSPYYWRWADTGPYYGMPWINLAGWMGTGVVIMGAVEALGGPRWAPKLPVKWLAGYYGVTLLMPFGMLVLEGLWMAVAVTLAAYAGAWAVHVLWSARVSPVPGRRQESSPTLSGEGP